MKQVLAILGLIIVFACTPTEKKQHEEQMMKTKKGGPVPHQHEYKPGKQRTETSLGHDHSLVYDKGKVVGIGPSPEDGHKHAL